MGKKLIFLAVLVVGLGAVVAVGYQRARTTAANQSVPVIKPEVVRAAPLELRSHATTEIFYGRIVANAELNMAFQIAGRLWSIGPDKDTLLKENDVLRKGDIIARLEPDRFKALVDQASAQTEEAHAEMAAADAVVKQAQAAADDALRSFRIQEELREKKAGLQREFDAAKLNLDVTNAQLEAASARHAKSLAVYNATKANKAVAVVNEKDATLRSPIDGKIATIPHEIGMMVRPGESVMRVVDLKKVKLIIGVVERKLPQVTEGLNVEVVVQALTAQAQATRGVDAKVAPRKGKVTMVPPAANPVTGLFDVEIELENEKGELKPGMIAKAMIRLRENHSVIAVPAEAVRRRAGKLTAFFITEGMPIGLDMGKLGRVELNVPTPVVRQFDLGDAILDDDHYLIFDPPKGVTQLVIEGQTRIADGSAVIVVNEKGIEVRPVTAEKPVPKTVPNPSQSTDANPL
ncbi:MAG: efflux RND transporter periplasmic adaptor subunit [Phycisphaeraceae bacterium]